MSMQIIINQIHSGQLSKQLIQDPDGSIALNKSSALALRETRLLKFNSSKHIQVYTFLFKINYLLHEFTPMDSLTYKNQNEPAINKNGELAGHVQIKQATNSIVSFLCSIPNEQVSEQPGLTAFYISPPPPPAKLFYTTLRFHASSQSSKV